MRNLRRFIFILLAFSLGTSGALADPPVTNDQKQGSPVTVTKRFFFSTVCEGTSDLPHKSTHVKGTVNVQARTTCPGQGVEISSRLTRIYRGIKTSVAKGNYGNGRTSVNLSMNCIWKKGMKKIRYEIRSTHTLSDGRVGVTFNYASLEC
jgi:hypothetical protein